MMLSRVKSPRHKAKVRFWQLPDDLAPCFGLFYHIELTVSDGARVTDHLIPEWGNLRFFASGTPRLALADGSVIETKAMVNGPTSQAMTFDLDSATLWGFGLLPLGWARFVGEPARQWANCAGPLAELDAFAAFAPLAKRLCRSGPSPEEQFDDIVAHLRAAAPPPRDAQRIMLVHEVMTNPYLTEVGEFAAQAGMSVRTLERLCARHFGFPPRLLLRRQRMMRSLTSFMLSNGKNWSETIDGHYHDQAHFVHEFHSFMGMTPTAYAQLSHPLLAPVMQERHRVWGAPVLGSDMPMAT